MKINTELGYPLCGNYLSISQKSHPIINVPLSLGLLVEDEFRAGGFKYFGESKKCQQKGKEGVLWLLSTVYHKSLHQGSIFEYVPLPAKEMERRFGKLKKARKRMVSWEALKQFCQNPKRSYLLDDGYYKPTIKSTCYRLNPEKITSHGDYFTRILEPTILNKIKKEKARFEEKNRKQKEVSSWKDSTNRKLSEEYTRINLDFLKFCEKSLNKVCQGNLNVSLPELMKWVEVIKDDSENSFCFHYDLAYGQINISFSHFSQEFLKVETKFSRNEELELITAIGDDKERKGNGEQNIHHRVPTFSSKQAKHNKKTCEERVEFFRKQQLLRSLLSLFLGQQERMVFTDDKGGRLYSTITNLKTEARRALRYFNQEEVEEELVSFDVKTCQPWLLGIEILNEYRVNRVEPPLEVYKYLDLIENRDFYTAIVEYSGGKLTRDEAKKQVMVDFYRSRYLHGNRNNEIKNPFTWAGKFLKKSFPLIWEWINNNRGDNVKSQIPIRLQRLEADYFIDIVIPELSKRGIWCLTIHDSVLIRAKDSEFVFQFLQESIKLFFGRKPLLSTERYSEEKLCQAA